MNNKAINNIDAEFRDKLLGALDIIYQEQLRKFLTKEEQCRAEFLKIWHHRWIDQDLSNLNPGIRES